MAELRLYDKDQNSGQHTAIFCAIKEKLVSQLRNSIELSSHHDSLERIEKGRIRFGSSAQRHERAKAQPPPEHIYFQLRIADQPSVN
jgi:hypothetical protein